MKKSIQGKLFEDEPELLEAIKKNPIRCDACGQLIAAHAKTMDKRLLALMIMAAETLWQRGAPMFSPFDKADVYGDSARMNSDFNKLHCWGLVKRIRYRVYRFTRLGVSFLFHGASIPRRVWVYNDVVYSSDPDLVRSDELDDRWQTQKQHYALDYITVGQESLPFYKQ